MNEAVGRDKSGPYARPTMIGIASRSTIRLDGARMIDI